MKNFEEKYLVAKFKIQNSYFLIDRYILNNIMKDMTKKTTFDK